MFIVYAQLMSTFNCINKKCVVLHSRLLGLTAPATVWLQYVHWPRSGVWRLRVVTAEGGMTQYGVTAVSLRCSSSDAGQQGAAVTLLGAGEGVAISWEKNSTLSVDKQSSPFDCYNVVFVKDKEAFFSWTKLRFLTSRSDVHAASVLDWIKSGLAKRMEEGLGGRVMWLSVVDAPSELL